MNELTIYSFLFFTPILSGLLLNIFKLKVSTTHRLFLAFSGAFLLAICVLHLIPDLYKDFSRKTGLFILLGFVLQLLLEFFSGGIEHGHFHSHENKVKVFPYAIFISLCVHAFIEGMALLKPHEHTHHHYNGSLLLGIIIHKIPVAIVLTTMLISKNNSKIITYLSLTVFSLAAPLGLFIGKTIGNHYTESTNILLAIAVGIFLHISTTILFETSEEHRFNLKKFTVILIGLIIAALTL